MLHLPPRVLERAVGTASEGIVILQGDELLFWNRAARAILGARGIRPPVPVQELDPGIQAVLLRGDLSLVQDHPTEIQIVDLEGGYRLVVLPEESEGQPHLARLLEAEQDVVVGQIAGAVAREIGAPLLGIQAAADRLLRSDSVSAEESRSHLETILDQSHRIAKLSRQLVDLAAPGTPRLTTVDPGTLVREAVELVAAAYNRADIELTISGADQAVPVQADRSQLQQVLLNLLLNARTVLETFPKERRVRVDLSGRNGYVRIRVADSGPGVRPEDAAKIFLPFTSEYGGTGLGLPMARQILSEIDGSLQLEESPLGGACFVITLRKAVDG